MELGIGRKERALPVDAKRLYEAVMGVWNDEAMRGRSREIMRMLERETAMDEVIARIEALADAKP